jgi:hypothetical protein
VLSELFGTLMEFNFMSMMKKTTMVAAVLIPLSQTTV